MQTQQFSRIRKNSIKKINVIFSNIVKVEDYYHGVWNYNVKISEKLLESMKADVLSGKAKLTQWNEKKFDLSYHSNSFDFLYTNIEI